MKHLFLLSVLVVNMTAYAQKKEQKLTPAAAAATQVPVSKYIQQRNTPPVANAGPDKTITLPTSSVLLEGSGQDRDNNIRYYRWSQLSGPVGGTITSIGSPQTTVTGLLQPGTYRFILTVGDAREAQGYDTTTITVNKALLPPTVNAGPDQTLTLPTNSTQLNGSFSDPNPNLRSTKLGLRARWDKLSGPASIRIVSPATLRTDVEGLTEGTYQLTLTVINGAGLTATDTVAIIVGQQPNQPPTVTAQRKKPIRLPLDSITLTGIGRDPDGDPLTYTWQELHGPGRPNIITPGSSTTTVTHLQQGEYQFVVTVSDNKGGIAADTVSIIVNAAAPLPPPKTPINNTASDTPVISPIPPITPPSPNSKPLWIWIAIGVVAIGAASTVLYFFWLPRPQKKVLIFFMNPEEETLAHRLLPTPQRTEGYIMGNASPKDIKRMRRHGLALRIINTSTLKVNTPGAARTYRYASKKGLPVLKSVSIDHPGENFVNILQGVRQPKDQSWPAFFIMTLDGPMLDAFRRRLEEAKAIVLQRIPDDSYIIQVNEPHQLDELNNKDKFGFIRAITAYTAEDTGFTVRKDRYNATFTSGPGAVLIMDVVLHREDDRARVNDFLGSNRVELLDSFGRTTRIRMRANPELPLLLASNKYIQAIYEHVPRRWYNDIARQIVGIDDPGPHHAKFITEDGHGEIVAVADTGIDQQHPDLRGRIIGSEAWGSQGGTDDPHGHGTHVAGTIAGDGSASNGSIKGMAPGVSLFFQSLLDDDENITELGMRLPDLLRQAYDRQARILNISWGAPTEAYYTFDANMIDRFVYDNPELLVVVSAGNDGTIRKDRNGKETLSLGSVGSPATTKNGLTVGASFSTRRQEDGESMTVFSSKGPCKPDRRIKPDIVAPGTHILSTRSSQAPARNFDNFYDNDSYVFLSGTSMATPMVSGAAAIVREYYTKQDNIRPSAALVKATLINGTRRLMGISAMGGTGMIPNNSQGFGILDLLHTVPNRHTPLMLAYRDSYGDASLALRIPGQRHMFRLTLKQDSWVRVCMVFIDNPASGIQTDLDLIMARDGTTEKWVGNEGINANDPAFADTENDFANNIEIIRIDQAATGDYTIEVVAVNIAPQTGLVFSLVVTTGDTTAALINIQP